jgi:GH24 family phage-related lysozyme (muramidase)
LPTLPAPTHYAYLDKAHKWTTGYGFNLDDPQAHAILATVTTKTKTQLIAAQELLTEEEALALLDIKIAQSQGDAPKLLRGFSCGGYPRSAWGKR